MSPYPSAFGVKWDEKNNDHNQPKPHV